MPTERIMRLVRHRRPKKSLVTFLVRYDQPSFMQSDAGSVKTDHWLLEIKVVTSRKALPS